MAVKRNKKIDKANLSFEAAMSEIEKITEKIEQTHCGLEEMVALYTRGMELQHYCTTKLKNAKMQIEQVNQKISDDEDGGIA